MAKNVQIRDLDDEVYAVLRGRSGRHLADPISQAGIEPVGTHPTMAELLERSDRRRARGGGSSRAAVEAAFKDDTADRR